MLPSESHFVPADLAGSSKETAVLLVGTAREFGVPQREIQLVMGSGFRISNRLRDVLYDEGVLDKKTSGNRAAKKKTSTKEK